jgi:excisionase family DNA binding protein
MARPELAGDEVDRRCMASASPGHRSDEDSTAVSRSLETDEMSSPNDGHSPEPGRGAWRDVFADALDVKGAAERLRVSRATVHEMVHNGDLVAVRLGGRWLLPAWQFNADGILPGVRRVLEDWPESTVSLSMWARTPSGTLHGRTPAQALEDAVDN